MTDAMYKIGDVVVAKSGGPRMIVDSLDHGARYSVGCRWWDGNNFSWSTFHPAQVRRIRWWDQ